MPSLQSEEFVEIKVDSPQFKFIVNNYVIIADIFPDINYDQLLYESI
mgnify:CR=1 FL=1